MKRDKKNRRYPWILALILVLSLTGCSKKTNSETVPAEKNPEAAQTTEVEAAPAGEETKSDSNSESINTGSESSKKKDTAPTKTETTEAEQEKETTGKKKPEKKATEEKILSFEDLSEYEYYFASGVGGWGTSLEIEKDGYFHGSFHDSDMGDVGDYYPEGTMYLSNFHGNFTDLKQNDDRSVTFTITKLTYDREPGEEDDAGGQRFIYSEAYGLEGTKTFTFYPIGTDIDDVSEDLALWVEGSFDDDGSLSYPILANDDQQFGFRTAKREIDPEAMLKEYRESYDYWGDMLSNANDQQSMNRIAGHMYRVADEGINALWVRIKYDLDDATYQKILKEQRRWIADKEAKGEEIEKEYEGGSMMSMVYSLELGSMTIDRCEELVAYLK